MDNELTYMDCWHFVAPLIPVNTDYARSIYCMVYYALNEADRQLKEAKAREHKERRKKNDDRQSD